MVFLAGTLSNTLGLLPAYNYISSNSRYGVQLAGGAHDNHVNYNHVASNVSHGILLTETNTADNVISNTLIYRTAAMGLARAAPPPTTAGRASRSITMLIYRSTSTPMTRPATPSRRCIRLSSPPSAAAIKWR